MICGGEEPPCFLARAAAIWEPVARISERPIVRWRRLGMGVLAKMEA
jgi:hypothetical protein